MPASLREIKGTVFNIQHYCIHDGPGIRTNVFVKGCPLRCLWCANPESQARKPQLMFRGDKCLGCGACAAVCPVGAVSLTDGPAKTDRTRCLGCGGCVAACPASAREIMGREITAGEAFDQVAGDALFYGSEGGLTVTGGEAFSQPAFTAALVKLCRQAGITTAVETCGVYPWEIMAPILKDVDTVLFDIKHMDSAAHKRLTGVGNEEILENLTRLSRETDCAIVIRCPVIPPCNDAPENFHALGRFLSEQRIRCQYVELLPYHPLGEGKRPQLEQPGAAFHTRPPTEQTLENRKNILRSYGLTAK